MKVLRLAATIWRSSTGFLTAAIMSKSSFECWVSSRACRRRKSQAAWWAMLNSPPSGLVIGPAAGAAQGEHRGDAIGGGEALAERHGRCMVPGPGKDDHRESHPEGTAELADRAERARRLADVGHRNRADDGLLRDGDCHGEAGAG